ncbi:hypothetical protein [Paenibacillus sp. MMS20-IR301]|uniref:hypothetical protein n=1 Tax=Paenibacillus sp. MMS20-IR301 TaxID=2895946 RepID=UPI0028E963DE|nr:hypothetical protein [Paenibacillus sp. MMS20-IR301]WNS46472.1 hypothetical protein LOS79_14825 [Paenibacillus sp. MMS20-IR301]
MRIHRLRSLPALAAAAVLMLAITACGGGQSAEAPGEPAVSPSPVETAAAEAPSPVPSPGPEATEEVQIIQGSGRYIGQIDNHSVEIETEEGPTAFELGAGTETAPELLEMDDAVVFAYVERVVGSDETAIQRVLSSLNKADGAEAP